MSKVKIDHGVTIDNRIRITSGLVSNHPYLYLLFKIIFIVIGVLAILNSWIIGMDLYVNERILLGGTIITVVIFTLMQEYPRAKIYIALVYLVSLAVSCYYYWEYFKNGFYCLENAFIKYASLYYGLNPYRYVVFLDAYKSTTLLLLLLVQIISFVVTVEVYKHYMRSIYMFLIFLFYGTLLALGIVPNGAWLIVLVAVYSCMRTMDRISNGVQRRLLVHKASNHEANIDGKLRIRIHSAFIVSAIFLVAFLIARIAVSPDVYDNKLKLVDVKKDLQKAIREFSISDTIEDIKEKWNEVNPFQISKPYYSGGLDSGKLGDVSSISFTGNVALSVAMDSDISYLYMKGFAGSVYLSDEWAQISEKDMRLYESIQEEFGDSSLNAETLLYRWLELADTYGIRCGSEYINNLTSGISMSQSDIYVTYEDANKKFLYAPYACNFLGLGELNYIGASYFAPENDKQDNYLFTNNYVSYDKSTSVNDLVSFIAPIHQDYEFDVPEHYYSDFKEYESAYRSFAHDVYTQLPEGIEQLKSVDLGIVDLDEDDTYQIITSVIKYLRDNTSYSLSPGVPRYNQDFAEYFLFDAKKGYCSHYATAAVLLLRNYGVPARYIEGYIVTSEDINKGILGMDSESSIAAVRDYNAHAWVEVYFDGVGWVPVEVTNGYSQDGTTSLLPQIEEEEKTTTPTIAEKPTQTPTITPSTVTEPVQKPSIAPTKVPVKVPSEQDLEKIPMGLMLFLLSFGCIVVITIILYLRYRVRKSNWKKFLMKGTSMQQVIKHYLAIERILKMLKIIKEEAQTYEEFAAQAMIQCDLLPKGFQEIVSLALKANFSEEEITEQEKISMFEYYHRFRTNYFNSQTKRKQFLLKYWEVL